MAHTCGLHEDAGDAYRAVIASGSVIRIEHLSIASPSQQVRAALSSLDDVEREQVIRILAATAGHKGRAAAILGVSRPRLARLMQKYELG